MGNATAFVPRFGRASRCDRCKASDEFTMRIVCNLDGHSHWASLVEHTKRAAHLVIVSPFTDEIMVRLFEEATGPTLQSVTIVTRLYDTPSEAYAVSVRLLRVIEVLAARPNVAVEIHENPQLHGKIYLTKEQDTFTYGLLGSANCTHHGLIRNHEWSVEITDAATLDPLWRDIERSLPRSTALSRADLERVAAEAKSGVQKNRAAAKAIKMMRLRLEDFLPGRKRRPATRAELPAVAAKKVWIKPVGDSQHRIDPTDDYWSETHLLHFSRTPRAVEVGHLVVVYATGWQKIVGLFEITHPWRPLSAAELAAWPEGRRWPWAASARPLTPRFAQNWFAEDLRLKELVSDFDRLPVTPQEKAKAAKVVPALRAHSDKVALQPRFAQFIIDELNRREAFD
jgi:hypothetical protein